MKIVRFKNGTYGVRRRNWRTLWWHIEFLDLKLAILEGKEKWYRTDGGTFTNYRHTRTFAVAMITDVYAAISAIDAQKERDKIDVGTPIKKFINEPEQKNE